MVSVSASHVVGHGFVPRPGHTINHPFVKYAVNTFDVVYSEVITQTPLLKNQAYNYNMIIKNMSTKIFDGQVDI